MYSNNEDEDIDGGTEAYEQELKFWYLEVEKMLSKRWYKKKEKDPGKFVEMKDKLPKNWNTKKR